MDDWWSPFNFSTMGSTSNPFNYYADPDNSIQFRPPARSPYGDDMVAPTREANAPPTSPSQVPGTSGSPAYTPAATPGGVSQSDGTGTASVPEPSAPYGYDYVPGGGYVPGVLAAMLAPGTSGGGNNNATNKQALALLQLGQKLQQRPNPMPQPQQQAGPAQLGQQSTAKCRCSKPNRSSANMVLIIRLRWRCYT
jgi:hypothetical protein